MSFGYFLSTCSGRNYQSLPSWSFHSARTRIVSDLRLGLLQVQSQFSPHWLCSSEPLQFTGTVVCPVSPSSSHPGMSLWALDRAPTAPRDRAQRDLPHLPHHMSLKLQCPFPAEIISTKWLPITARGVQARHDLLLFMVPRPCLCKTGWK